jgi:hypothetical protein
VLGQTPDQQQSQSDATIRELKRRSRELEQQVGGVTQHFQQQGETSLQDQIEVGDSRPHFEIIAPHIAAEMRDGAAPVSMTPREGAAEVSAARGHREGEQIAAPEEAKPAASSAAAPDLEAQTLRGQKSIKGAPGSGSEPAAQPRSSSIKEALKRAAAKAG